MREGSDGMREILFRGKNIVTGELVYGYLVEEASYFVSNCYLLIRELLDRKPDEPIKLI